MSNPATRHDRVLQGVSSVLLNSPTKHGAKELRDASIPSKQHTPERRKKATEGEIISDSEEERIRLYPSNNRTYTYIDPNIIEISSDEEEDMRSIQSSPEDPFTARVPGAWPTNNPDTSKPEDDSEELSQIWSPRSSTKSSKPRKSNPARRMIESSSSDGSDTEGIIELTDSSSERSIVPKAPPPEACQKPIVPVTDIGGVKLPLSAELDDIWNDNSAILTLDEPKSARKPIRHIPSLTEGSTSSRPSMPRKNSPFQIGFPSSDGGITRIADPTPVCTPSRAQPAKGALATPPSNTSPRKGKQPPRTSKKAQAAAEQAKREVYAQQLFTELNCIVFKDGLPKETKLNWNKRLLTTAGRAKWHRSRDGTQTTEIELAEKILDCEERIRNTLSHEMCHLASWIIDADPKEGHGRLWKAWASKVMRKRPEIDITTRHDYEISYPYEWECKNCAKIYGRFSKSIRPDECVCGSCKVGKLIPLFLAPSRAPKTPKTSRMAAAKPQDSPCSVHQPSHISHRDTEKDGIVFSSRGPIEVYTIHDSDSESDLDIRALTTVMGSVTIIASETA